MTNKCETCRTARLAVVVVLLAALVARASGYLRKPANKKELHPMAYKSTVEMVLYWGYPVEKHTVQTEDGYILTMHRIPWGRETGPPKKGEAKTPVLVGHGLASSSEQWVTRPGNESLVFLLADRGFDVWMTNYRGSFYSVKHKYLTFKDNKFWDFSWHHNGVYDTPAMVDYILAETGRPSLMFVCHSMGCAAQVVFLAERPEYAHKVRANFLMAPSVYFTKPEGAFAFINLILPRALPPINPVVSLWPTLMQPRPEFCVGESLKNSDSAILLPICFELMRFSLGRGISKNQSNMVGIMYHWPNGASTGQVLHFAQSILNGGTFRKYDYGRARNLRTYGKSTPPSYDLSRINSPIHLFYATNDYAAMGRDVEKLGSEIPTLAGLHRVENLDFNHYDFIAGEQSYELVYKQLISLMIQYTNKKTNT